MISDYADLYTSTWETHKLGLKIVLGGTGIGKTSGMQKAIQQELNDKSNRKFIYCTYRHNLIQEQEAFFKSNGIKNAYLKGKADIIAGLVEENRIDEIFEGLRSKNLFGKGDAQKKQILAFNSMIQRIRARKEILESNHSPNLRKELEEEYKRACSGMLDWFKGHFRKALKSSSQKKADNKFLKLKETWALFPYIQFKHDPHTHVLLGTIHKFLKGFFDGSRNLKLASIEDSVLFLDEFDFLENQILKVLAEESSIQNPIEFVRFFYEDFDYWSKMEFWNRTEILKDVYRQFQEIRRKFDDDLRGLGLSFPTVRLFRCEQNEFKKGELRVFETGTSILSQSFFFKEEDSSWWLKNTRKKGSIYPEKLFFIFKKVRDKIIGVFNKYRSEQAILEEIIQFIWNNKNDGEKSVYSSYILDHIVYHRSHEVRKNTWEKLQTTGKVSGYDLGFRMFKMRQGKLEIDPKYVEMDQVELLTSPESIVAKIADKNLVFALSATSDIPRLVQSFNLEWLRKNVQVHEFSSDDFAMLEEKKKEKSALRQTKVHLDVIPTLHPYHPWEELLDKARQIGFFRKEDKEEDKAEKLRQDRVSRALNTIFHALEGEQGHSHLIFLSSFHHLKQILTGEDLMPEVEVIVAAKRSIKQLPLGYHIEMDNMSFNVLFFNADKNKEIQASELGAYKALFKSEFTFVVTQYNSASNGVNLPCFSREGESKDFDGIHLADGQYFWLSVPIAGTPKYKPQQKILYWYLWKLVDDGVISTKFFRRLLGDSREKHPNNHYQRNVEERTLNNIALYYQALGRVERKWESTPNLHISLAPEVHLELKNFLTGPSFEKIRNQRKQSNSTLVEKLNLILGAESEFGIDAKHKVYYGKRESEAEEKINRMVKELHSLRSQSLSCSQPIEVRKGWTELRKAILNQDWEKDLEFPLKDFSYYYSVRELFCVAVPSTWRLDKLAKDPHKKNFLPGKRYPSDIAWNPQALFHLVSQNPAISAYFLQSGFPMECSEAQNGFRYLLCPFAEQSLLKGAIGEAALMALFMDKMIPIEPLESLPDELFEEVDFKVQGKPFYIDAKNYSLNTMFRMQLSPGDPRYEFKLDSEQFLKHCGKKLKRLKAIGGSDAVLVIINLFAAENAIPGFFNQDLDSLPSQKGADLIILPGALQRKDPALYTSAFELFANYISPRK